MPNSTLKNVQELEQRTHLNRLDMHLSGSLLLLTYQCIALNHHYLFSHLLVVGVWLILLQLDEDSIKNSWVCKCSMASIAQLLHLSRCVSPHTNVIGKPQLLSSYRLSRLTGTWAKARDSPLLAPPYSSSCLLTKKEGSCSAVEHHKSPEIVSVRCGNLRVFRLIITAWFPFPKDCPHASDLAKCLDRLPTQE